MNRSSSFTLSIVTPAYNESGNLEVLHQELCDALEESGILWEWIIIDDHSHDNTFNVIKSIASDHPNVRGIRLSKNCGSHLAMLCGFSHARGKCAILMAADLQDPPDIIIPLIAKWRTGKSSVVWAVREKREGESSSAIAFSFLYYWIMRHIVGLRDMSPTGADFFLIDRIVIDALSQYTETHVQIMALITWMGFDQDSVTYTKRARASGSSGWSFEKKMKLAIDSIISFSYLPVRLMSYVGFITSTLGFMYAGFVIWNVVWGGRPVEGWSSLMVAILVIGGLQMTMMGVLGEYVWRALDESRRRPRYLIERVTGKVDTGQ